MKTGDTVRDELDRSYKVGLHLGRGTWGRTWRLTRDSDGADLVAKCPLIAADFGPGTPDVERLLADCLAAVQEQARLLREGTFPFLPALEATLALEDGGQAIVMARFPNSLEQRLLAGCSFAEAMDLIVQVAKQCQQLRDGPGLHGAIKPQNVLLTAEGEVRLTDVATPQARRALPRLAAAAGGDGYLPPEIAEATGEPPYSVVADTYALGRLVWRAVLGAEPTTWPAGGLDKAAQVALKDRLHARVKQEDSNPRFHGRLADRVASTLSRALSTKASPTPPYRFDRLDELCGRLEELRSLVRPEVATVGRVLLERPANVTHFSTDEAVVFSVSVGCSPGVDRHEEIGCGVAVVDRDTGERLRDVPSTFDVSRHPSGRYRYQFRITDLRPGSYRVRVAFAIRDSGHEPRSGDVELEVRAAHGYVPPPEQPPAGPLPIRNLIEEPNTVTAPLTPEPLLGLTPPPPAPAPPEFDQDLFAGSSLEERPKSSPAQARPAPASAPRTAAVPTPPAPALASPTPAAAPAPAAAPEQARPALSVPTPRPAPAQVKPAAAPAPEPETRPLPPADARQGRAAGAGAPAQPTAASVVPPTPPAGRTAVVGAAPSPAVSAAPGGAGTARVFHGGPLPAKPADTAVPVDHPSQETGRATGGARNEVVGGGPAGKVDWLALPMETTAARDFDALPDDVDELEEYRPRSAWRQVLDTIRGDLYSMLVLGAAIVIGILLILLLLLKG